MIPYLVHAYDHFIIKHHTH